MSGQTTSTKVLIVEDEVLIALDIQRMLTLAGYEVIGKVRDSNSALAFLSSTTPDIVLLDINLENGSSGVEVAKWINAKCHCPFIFLTALADSATLEHVKDTMPYGYVVKPFTVQDLSAAITLALHRFQNQRSPSRTLKLADINQRLIEALSAREFEVLCLLEEGLTYREIGERLFIGLNTVKSHQKSLFAKIGVSSRYQMGEWLRK